MNGSNVFLKSVVHVGRGTNVLDLNRKAGAPRLEWLYSARQWFPKI
jgi:hypothetical protein